MTAPRRALVFGSSGLIGRWLVKELLEQHVEVVAAVRSGRTSADLRHWLEAHDVDPAFDDVAIDLRVTGMGLAQPPIVSEIFNLAGAYAFGMSAEDAREANVLTAARVVELAARTPSLQRLLHVSGYRVGGIDPRPAPWSDHERTTQYKRLGAYEASKTEGDRVVRAEATRLGVPWTVINPATVIGHSLTGESHQTIGLASTVLDLSHGRLRAMVGDHRTFVPVVTADYLAKFIALAAIDPTGLSRSYWLLDDLTPSLPTMLRFLAGELGVEAPRLRLPVAFVKKLPPTVSKVDPETLSFISADRYPTEGATALARSHGLEHPSVLPALASWAKYLVSQSDKRS